MTRILTVFFVLAAFSGFAQQSKLSLTIDVYSYYELECPEIFIVHQKDTVRRMDLEDYFALEIDSLLPGNYAILLAQCTDSVHFMKKQFTLYPDSVTDLTLSYSAYTDFESLRKDSVTTGRLDSQFSLGYTNNRWMQSNPALTSSAYAAITQSSWYTLSRHFGLLAGGGFGLTHSSVAQDTTFMEQPLLQKRYEYYNYLDLHFKVALRFTTGNQQRQYTFSKFTLDLGANYNLPIAFKHVARYKGNQKFMKGGLHQFTDCRVFVNFGYAPCLFFAEYRLFDFILGSYPELPTWNFGLRIDIQN